MKSKFLNSVAALMNFLFGVIILVYSFIAPNEARATANEIVIMNQIHLFTLLILIAVTVANLILLIANRHNGIFLFAYIISILASAFYIFNFEIISILYLLSALLICMKVLRENIIEKTNNIFMIILSIIISSIILLGLYSLTYKDFVVELDKKENIGQIKYDEDYFKNISELGLNDLYINVQKDGKWGYINQKGEKVIDFKYDYASPFVQIEKNNKKFDIALVCIEDTGEIILKNERIVYSYKNNIDLEDYEAQYDKLREIYVHVLKQEKDFDENIISNIKDRKHKISAYEENGYIYPFNDDYDIHIKVSSQMRKNK